MRRYYLVLIRRAEQRQFLSAYYLGRAVAGCLLGAAVNLDQLGEVYLHPFLHADETPNLVQLNVFGFYAFDRLGQESFAVLTDDQNQVGQRLTAKASEALDAANRHSFEHQAKGHRGLLHRDAERAERAAALVALSYRPFWQNYGGA